jgi:hypothetical protein
VHQDPVEPFAPPRTPGSRPRWPPGPAGRRAGGPGGGGIPTGRPVPGGWPRRPPPGGDPAHLQVERVEGGDEPVRLGQTIRFPGRGRHPRSRTRGCGAPLAGRPGRPSGPPRRPSASGASRPGRFQKQGRLDFRQGGAVDQHPLDARKARALATNPRLSAHLEPSLAEGLPAQRDTSPRCTIHSSAMPPAKQRTRPRTRSRGVSMRRGPSAVISPGSIPRSGDLRDAVAPDLHHRVDVGVECRQHPLDLPEPGSRRAPC